MRLVNFFDVTSVVAGGFRADAGGFRADASGFRAVGFV